MDLNLGQDEIEIMMRALTEYLFSGEELGYSERAVARKLLERLSAGREGINDGSRGIVRG